MGREGPAGGRERERERERERDRQTERERLRIQAYLIVFGYLQFFDYYATLDKILEIPHKHISGLSIKSEQVTWALFSHETLAAGSGKCFPPSFGTGSHWLTVIGLSSVFDLEAQGVSTSCQ
jgi:hypothetical protein